MNDRISLDAPIKTILARILSSECEAGHHFGRSSEEDHFFRDLLYIGCDFYEILALFASCDAIGKNNYKDIIENIPSFLSVRADSDKEIRKMILHWTSSPYRSASIEEICGQLKKHIKDRDNGVFVYNSNLNTKDKRTYNDMYILLSRKCECFFFDINRKKAYKLCS